MLLISFGEASTWGRRTGTNARALIAWELKHEFFLALSLPGRGVVDDTSVVHECGSNAVMTMPEAGSCFASAGEATHNVDEVDDDEEDDDDDDDEEEDDDDDAIFEERETVSAEGAPSTVCTEGYGIVVVVDGLCCACRGLVL